MLSTAGVPQKNGNQDWSALVHAYRTGAAPASYQRVQVDDCTLVGSEDRILFIARNPYVR